MSSELKRLKNACETLKEEIEKKQKELANLEEQREEIVSKIDRMEDLESEYE